MSGFWSVYKREIRGYFLTPIAYVFLVIFLFFSSFLTFQSNFMEIRTASLQIFFSNMPLLFIFLSPAIPSIPVVGICSIGSQGLWEKYPFVLVI